MTTSMEVVPEQGQLTTNEMAAVEEEKKSLGNALNESAEIRQAVSEFVGNDPKFTAGIIRKWLKEKAPPA